MTGYVSHSDRAVMARTTVARGRGEVSARVVETAMAIKASDPLVHADANIDMQSSKQDSGWDKTKTRGSGIVFNDAGKLLFEAAVERVGSSIEEGMGAGRA